MYSALFLKCILVTGMSLFIKLSLIGESAGFPVDDRNIFILPSVNPAAKYCLFGEYLQHKICLSNCLKN